MGWFIAASGQSDNIIYAASPPKSQGCRRNYLRVPFPLLGRTATTIAIAPQRRGPSLSSVSAHFEPAEKNAQPARTNLFPTTQWSVVLSAGAATQQRAFVALGILCERYWYPLYGFVRRQGRSYHEAEDITQQFFAVLLEREGIASARPERGRFRTFLLTSLRNFMTDTWRQGQSAKRGGGQVPLSLDFSGADERFAHELSDANLPPDYAFDRNWAFEIIERALTRLRADYESTGRGALFAALAPHIWSDAPLVGPDAGQLRHPGMNTHALTMALHRLRRRLGLCLHDEVAATVADGTDVDAELRQLIAAVGGKIASGN